MKKWVFILSVPAILANFPDSGNREHNKIDCNKVKVESGLISGITGLDGNVLIFMGVPFAAPPVNSLRWKPPQNVQAWDGIRKCVTPPPSAMQSTPKPFMMWSKEFMAPEEPLSEDCLYLNIWTAAKKKNEKRPVIVWIHGGAFTGGSGTVPLYNGEEMAKKGVVFVTINYRLGIFGFFAHPELSAESPKKVSGNYGILDQIAALKWVIRNISAFGGDPGNVTIAGQSAGSFSVNALMVSHLARGLFHRAIGESGGMFSNAGIVSDLKTAEDAGVKFFEKQNVSSVEALRLKPAGELISASGRWGIAIDNYVIPYAGKTFDDGKQNDVPLISGWNSDDGFSMGAAPNAESFRANAVKNYGDNATEYMKLFPAGNNEEAKASQKLMAQLSFGWQNYHWAGIQSTTGKSKAYLYYFTRVPPGEPDYGAFHSAEFGYALNNLDKWNRPFVKCDRDLSEIMSSYWVNFAAHGDPNGKGLPYWPAFNKSEQQVIILGDTVVVKPLPHRAQLEFLEKINK